MAKTIDEPLPLILAFRQMVIHRGVEATGHAHHFDKEYSRCNAHNTPNANSCESIALFACIGTVIMDLFICGAFPAGYARPGLPVLPTPELIPSTMASPPDDRNMRRFYISTVSR